MTNIIIGNLIAFVASSLMIYSGILKKKEEIIYVHSVEKALSVVSNIVLNGITGAITNAIGFVRNLLCYKDKLKTKEKIIIIVATLVFSLQYNNLGIVGLLPIFATVLYTLFMDTKNIIKFKILAISTTIMWLIYNAYIMAYTSVVIQIFQIVANIIAVWRINKENKAKKGM